MTADVQPQLFTTSRAEAALFRFPPLFFPLLSVLALVSQAYLPVVLHVAVYLDLPLWVVVYWGLCTRNQAGAALLGAGLGMAQDSLAHMALGLNGMALTLVGYMNASLGSKVDSDHVGVRFSLMFACYALVRLLVFCLGRFLLGTQLLWNGEAATLAAFANACLAVMAFGLLDRFRHRL